MLAALISLLYFLNLLAVFTLIGCINLLAAIEHSQNAARTLAACSLAVVRLNQNHPCSDLGKQTDYENKAE